MRGVLFDLDGTLTDCRIDYAAIRRDLGLDGGPILEQVDPDDPAVARVLDRHEAEAAEGSVIADGARELLDRLAVPAAIVTRNSRAAAAVTLARHGLRFAAVVTREDRPHKPHPHPVRHAARLLNLPPAHCLMVGDGANDIESGVAAGCPTAWVSHGRRRDFAAEPCVSVRDLPALLRELQTGPRWRGLLREDNP